MKIAIDAMGGDNGSKPVIEAVKEFLNKYPGNELVVFGKEEELQELNGLCRIVNAPDVVPSFKNEKFFYVQSYQHNERRRI